MSKAPKKQRNHYPDEKQAMFGYLAKIAAKEKKPLVLTELWRNYKKEHNSRRSCEIIYRLWSKIRYQIEIRSEFPLEMRILMLIASHTPVSQKFINKLDNTIEIVLDDKKNIIKYKKNNETIYSSKKEPISREFVNSQRTCDESEPADQSESETIEEPRNVTINDQIEEIDSESEEIDSNVQRRLDSGIGEETLQIAEKPRVPDSFDNFLDYNPLPNSWDYEVEDENEIQILTPPDPFDISTSVSKFFTQQKSVLIQNDAPEFRKLAEKCQVVVDKLKNNDKRIYNVQLAKIMKNAFKEITEDISHIL